MFNLELIKSLKESAQQRQQQQGNHNDNNSFLRKNDYNNKESLLMAISKSYDGKPIQFASDDLKNDKDVILAAISKNGSNLLHASDTLKDDAQVLLAAIHKAANTRVKNDFPLQYASPRLLNDRDIVLAAVQKWGRALQYTPADSPLRDDKEIVLAAIHQSKAGSPLAFASEQLRDDPEVVSEAARKGCIALSSASERLKRNKEIVMVAVSNHGDALKYASQELQDDDDVVCQALQNSLDSCMDLKYDSPRDGSLPLKYASPRIRNLKHIVLEAMRQNGDQLQYASDDLRRDKECVLAAISQKPETLKFALGGLNQDRDCLIAAGLWDVHYDEKSKEEPTSQHPETIGEQDTHLASQETSSHFPSKHTSKERDIPVCTTSAFSTEIENRVADGILVPECNVTLSLRFSLDQESTPTATQFVLLLKSHPFFSAKHPRKHHVTQNIGKHHQHQQHYHIYNPNAFEKGTCDPQWTRLEWPCRGTFDTCGMDPSVKQGIPEEGCCWRYSFRWHLQQSKDTNGYMIQVIELRETSPSFWEYELGKGQSIERQMAQMVGVQLFEARQPRKGIFPSSFSMKDIDELVEKIQVWNETTAGSTST